MLFAYKPLGLTPLQLIQEIKQRYPLYQNATISFAGRLDPMAEGLMLLLVNEENKQRNLYEKMEKTYQCEVLLGVKTDTYDILGLINTTYNKEPISSVPRTTLQNVLEQFIGTWDQRYPAYSSMHVNGKPLFYYARAGRLSDISIPQKKVTVSSISIEEEKNITPAELEEKVQSNIALVHGDFRQNDILLSWKDFFATQRSTFFQVFTLTIVCSSGTYVRGIAHSIGDALGIGAVAFSIKRTKINSFSVADTNVILL